MIRTTKLSGFSLLEVLVSIVILGIITTLAVPAFRTTQERNDIIAAAEALSADLRWSRSEALKRNMDISVIFSDGAEGAWQYVIKTASTPPTPLKLVDSSIIPDFQRIALTDNFSSHDLIFNHSRGTTEGQAGSVTLTTREGNFSLKVIVGNLERVRICSAIGAIGGYAAC